MALTTLASVRQIPGLTNSVTKTDPWINALITAASNCIKRYCKQNLELANYGGPPITSTVNGDSGYYNGNLEVSLVLRQKPVWSGTTVLDSSMNGKTLPQASITVLSVAGFNPNGGTLSVQTGNSTFAAVTYTSISGLIFTGCTGGTGTLSSATSLNAVAAPVVWVDGNGRFGTNPQAFPTVLAPSAYTLMVDSVDVDGNPTSNRALLQRVGGGTMSGFGYLPQAYMGGGKLAAYGLPTWERGQGNIRVAYSAGYLTVPDDLQFACNTMIANMVRFQPNGTDLSSESLGSYSYSVLQKSLGQITPGGSLGDILSFYREVSI